MIPVKKTLKDLGVQHFQEPKVNLNVLAKREGYTKEEKARIQKLREARKAKAQTKFMPIGMSNIDIAKNHLVGIEFESRFDPTGPVVRAINKEILDLKLADAIHGRYDLFRLLRHTLLNDFSDTIIGGPPVNDGGGLEFRFHPTTLKAHHHLRGEYSRIMKCLSELGFTDAVGGDGIHLNIDNKAFGDHRTEKRKSFANFLWFLYKNQEFMIEFCNRKNMDDGMADMMTLLNDRYGNKSAQEVEQEFIRNKNDLLDALVGRANRNVRTRRSGLYDSPTFGGSGTRKLNIHVNRDGRDCIEFRWFGSTFSINIFMSFIDFAFALPEYSKSHNSPTTVTLESFCEYVANNKSNYADLYSRLLQMKTSQQAMLAHREVLVNI